MAEVLVEFATLITGDDGRTYRARAWGDEMHDGLWQGWVEFLPEDAGEPVRSPRETTQPNREDAIYWATGLRPVYLEGSLRRAQDMLTRPSLRSVLPGIFDSPSTRRAD